MSTPGDPEAGPTSIAQELQQLRAYLAAIITNSEDAIVSKTLNGIVTSWNAAAERLFGYTAEEMIGSPILKIIPLDRHHEETAILSRIRLGERVDRYETVRCHKSGALLDISLTGIAGSRTPTARSWAPPRSLMISRHAGGSSSRCWKKRMRSRH